MSEVDRFDALLCALVLAPASFPRNRFYDLYEGASGKRLRRRAKQLRGLVRQLLGQGRERAELLGRLELEDGSILINFQVENMAFRRSTLLSSLEAAILNYALHRAGREALLPESRLQVERALGELKLLDGVSAAQLTE